MSLTHFGFLLGQVFSSKIWNPLGSTCNTTKRERSWLAVFGGTTSRIHCTEYCLLYILYSKYISPMDLLPKKYPSQKKHASTLFPFLWKITCVVLFFFPKDSWYLKSLVGTGDPRKPLQKNTSKPPSRIGESNRWFLGLFGLFRSQKLPKNHMTVNPPN